MKKSSKAIVTLFIFISMVACGNASDEPGEVSNTQSQTDDHSIQDTDDDHSNVDSTAADNHDTESMDENNMQPTNNIPETAEDFTTTIHTDERLNETYLQRLEDTKNDAEALEATDSSTFALKKVENDRWEMWDDLLNDIYGTLQEQLPPEEMELLREEQREWLEYRDESALEASLAFKGGTQEHVEYVAVLANVTEERCFELVENYMR